METKVFKPRGGRLSKDETAYCVERLREGGVIAFPTDTVYGLGCSAFHPGGIEKIYRLKGRSYTKPLPVLLADPAQLSLVAAEVPSETRVLIEAYWPGALTLVFKTAPLALHASRGKSTIAVRVPDLTLTQELLRGSDVPLAVTSANKSGKPALTTAEDVKKFFRGKVDVIVDGGECRVGLASTVIDATHVPFTVLREGAVSKLELIKMLKLG